MTSNLQRFGKYWIERKIAIGGMAEIYRAYTSAGEPVAIKMILPDYASQAKFIQMFLDEARIAITLHHRNLVQMLDFGRVDDTYFFSMEWVDGKPLSSIVKRQLSMEIPFPIEVALLICMDVCEGLACAHNKTDQFNRPLGIVHRDISPPNILITRDAMSKVADFGIADAKTKGIQTQPGVIRGKFSYMSPEQATGEVLDGRSDLFSVGIVLYELLSGKRLFLRDREVETLTAVRRCEIPPIRSFNPAVSPALDQVLRKALAKEKKRRYASAEDLGLDLQKILSEEYPEASGKDLAEFMKVLFPSERFFGVEDTTDQLVERWKRDQQKRIEAYQKSPASDWVEKLVARRWEVGLALGLGSLGLAEWIAR